MKLFILIALLATPLAAQTPLSFVAVDPCRLMDTRIEYGFTGAFGPPPIKAATSRTLPIPAHPTCKIPVGARAYVLNVTVVPLESLGFLTLWPTGGGRPNVSTLNALDGQIVANAAIVRAGTNGGVDLYASDATDIVVDINGYFTGTGEVSPPDPPAVLIDPRSIPDWRQVEPLVGAQAGGWTIPLSSIKGLDLALLTKWRRKVVEPCVTHASITFAPGSGPILVTGIGVPDAASEEAFYKDKAREWKFWFAR